MENKPIPFHIPKELQDDLDKVLNKGKSRQTTQVLSNFTVNHFIQGSHRLEKYLNIQNCLEKSLKIKFFLEKYLKNTHKSLNFTVYRRIQQCFWRPKSV